MESVWQMTESSWQKTYQTDLGAGVRATGQGYGPLYEWKVWRAGQQLAAGHANTAVDAQTGADAYVAAMQRREKAAGSTPASDLLLTDAESYFDRLVKERRWAGRKTYGGGLEHTDTRYNWTRMALEEALDMGQYLAARCRELEDKLAQGRVAWLEAQSAEDRARFEGYAADGGSDLLERLPPEWWIFEP